MYSLLFPFILCLHSSIVHSPFGSVFALQLDVPTIITVMPDNFLLASSVTVPDNGNTEPLSVVLAAWEASWSLGALSLPLLSSLFSFFLSFFFLLLWSAHSGSSGYASQCSSWALSIAFSAL